MPCLGIRSLQQRRWQHCHSAIPGVNNWRQPAYDRCGRPTPFWPPVSTAVMRPRTTGTVLALAPLSACRAVTTGLGTALIHRRLTHGFVLLQSATFRPEPCYGFLIGQSLPWMSYFLSTCIKYALWLARCFISTCSEIPNWHGMTFQYTAFCVVVFKSTLSNPKL